MKLTSELGIEKYSFNINYKIVYLFYKIYSDKIYLTIKNLVNFFLRNLQGTIKKVWKLRDLFPDSQLSIGKSST